MLTKLPIFKFSVAVLILTVSFLPALSVSAQEVSSDEPLSLARPPTNLLFHNNHSQYEDRYHEVWALIEQNTMYPERLTNWKSWEHRFDGQLHSDTSALEAANELVAVLGDEYTYYKDPIATRVRELEYEQKNVVCSRMEQETIGYIQIKTFASRYVASEFEEALEKTAIASSYIIDLRGNRGGSVDEAFKVFSMLVDQGQFVHIVGRLYGREYDETLALTPRKLAVKTNGVRTFRTRVANKTGRKPMIVLVDNNTRSASEMLAGALQDNGRAKLLGQKTYGKGVVQNTWILDDGSSIKIAIGRYYLPSGVCINGQGLTPDSPFSENTPQPLSMSLR